MNISLINKIAVFDLDGTLLDVKERYFRIFYSFISLNGIEYNYFIENYLNDRNIYKSDSEILKVVFGLNSSRIIRFKEFKLNQIEDIHSLVFDVVKPSVFELLQLLKKQGYRIELLTARRVFNNLLSQLENLNLLQYFDNVMMWPKNLFEKNDYIKLLDNGKNEILVFGDSMDDYLAIKNTSSTFFLVADTILDQSFASQKALTIDEILIEFDSRESNNL
jgi:phosphoglycolate phosphatase-like HAD superfamily hydrolase